MTREKVCSVLFMLLVLFLLPSFDAHADIIIDNSTAGTSYTGSWGVSGGTTPYGANSLWARDGATYTWAFSSQPAGTYEVFMWWSGLTNRATNIAVQVNSADGPTMVYINQQLNAGQWNSLGVYNFGTSGSVRITAAYGSTVSTCADAVKFSYASTGIHTISATAGPGEASRLQGRLPWPTGQARHSRYSRTPDTISKT